MRRSRSTGTLRTASSSSTTASSRPTCTPSSARTADDGPAQRGPKSSQRTWRRRDDALSGSRPPPARRSPRLRWRCTAACPERRHAAGPRHTSAGSGGPRRPRSEARRRRDPRPARQYASTLRPAGIAVCHRRFTSGDARARVTRGFRCRTGRNRPGARGDPGSPARVTAMLRLWGAFVVLVGAAARCPRWSAPVTCTGAKQAATRDCACTTTATQEVSDEQYDEQRRREGGGGRDRPGAT